MLTNPSIEGLVWWLTSLLKAASSFGSCLQRFFHPQAPAGQRSVKPCPFLAAKWSAPSQQLSVPGGCGDG